MNRGGCEKLERRLTSAEDYPELVSWWKYHKWNTPPTLELLDNLRFGIMISIDGENICAGFIYFTNAKAFGIMEYIISTNIIRDKKIRTQAIRLLILSLCEIAEKKGVKRVFSFLKSEHLIKHYEACDFRIGGKDYTSMVKVI